MTRSLIARLGVILVLPALLAGLVPAAAVVARAGVDPVVAAPAPAAVTLITGDRVLLESFPDGRQAATVVPAERGGGAPAFRSLGQDGNLYIIPEDVAGYIPEKLDRELFNVSRLVKDGYDDRSTAEVPLIVVYKDAPVALPDIRPLRAFPSINAAAAREEKARAAEFGKAVSRDALRGAGGAGPLDGVEKIWLDGRVQAALEDSVPQIGAPSAWAAGFTGTGVTVAVLDTGIDDRHPDLVGKVSDAKDFSGSPSGVTDRLGHGTHVASIVAGSGVASGGKRMGVAFGATLLNGKVLGDQGSGTFEGVMAGMQWAAAEKHAQVVNMSLGGGPTDGKDPVSLLVNKLTEQYGTLFLIAAGNFGGEQTVATPGAADAALTVGAVDKRDVLAPFSSRGPRLGDFAIKPEITAPGVNIIAARAPDGVFPPEPSNPQYTRLSGTSMATPHTAGAAALLRQKYPAWKPDAVKAALVSTAMPRPENTVYQQGGGRVDVAHAFAGQVFATTPVANLGYFPWPHGEEPALTAQVSYANGSDEAVTLALSLDIKDAAGRSPADGMVALKQDRLTLAAGGSGSAEVALDVTKGEVSLYGGYLTARQEGGELVLHTPVGFYKEPPMYNLTIKVTGLDGKPASRGFLIVMNVEDVRRFVAFRPVVAGQVKVRIPPGPYSVMGDVLEGPPLAYALLGHPQIEITQDSTLELDAREANPISLEREADLALLGVAVGWFRTDRSRHSGVAAHSFFLTPADVKLFAQETEPVSIGLFQASTRWELEAAASSSTHDLVFVERDRIPASLDYRIDPAQLATIANRFHSHKPDHVMGVARHYFPPDEFFSTAVIRPVTVPRERTEFVSAGETRWFQFVFAELPFQPGHPPIPNELEEPLTKYTPGEMREQTWFRQPLRASVGSGLGGAARFKGPKQDILIVSAAQLVDADGHAGFQPSPPTGSTVTALRLLRNGTLIGSSDRPFFSVEVPGELSEYRFEMEVDNSKAPWATMSPRTKTAWTFTSQGASEPGLQVIPLLVLDYDLDVDLLNVARVKGGRAGDVTLRVRHDRGAADIPITGLRIVVSFDDGQTWQDVKKLRDLGDGVFQASLGKVKADNPTGFVSLRTRAEDAAGNAIEQEIIRAFALPRRGDDDR